MTLSQFLKDRASVVLFSATGSKHHPANSSNGRTNPEPSAPPLETVEPEVHMEQATTTNHQLKEESTNNVHVTTKENDRGTYNTLFLLSVNVPEGSKLR